MKDEEKELLLELEHGAEPGENETEILPDFEHGTLSTEEALAALAAATGKTPEETAEIWQRGIDFDPEKFAAGEKDGKIFEELAEIRGISKKEMQEELLWALKKAKTGKAVKEIMAANPGMNEETAGELAAFRLEKAKKGEAQSEALPQAEVEPDWNGKLRELDEFLSAHSGEGIEKFAAEIVDEWEKGIPLEDAYKKFALGKKNLELLEGLEALKAAKLLEEQKAYAKAHSTGSATSNAESAHMDDFVAGLFREY